MKKLVLPTVLLAFVCIACQSGPPPSNPAQPDPNIPPTALLEVETTSAKRGIKATVTASDPDGDNLTYAWDFGDGSTASGQTTREHSYASDGTYTVKVTVSDGTNTVSANEKISVSFKEEPSANRAPTVSLSVETVEAKRTIRTIATASDPDGDTLSYYWSFGDGEGATSNSSKTHSYAESGTYTVTVTVSDGALDAYESASVTVQHLRPPNSPDVVIIGFSGRCGFAGVGCLSPPSDNHAYLHLSKNQTLQAIANTLENLGFGWEYFSFSAHLTQHFSDISGQLEFGYLQAEAYLESVIETSVADYDNPTRLVLVGHSHGVAFASLLAWNHPEATFDYFVALDGVCAFWESDHLRFFKDYFGMTAGMPFPIEETGGVCDSLLVPGVNDALDLEDVMPSNVTYGLEVISDLDIPPNIIHDDDLNFRPNGSYENLYLYVAESGAPFYNPDQGHTQVIERGAPAMNWVVSAINTLGLPSVSGITLQEYSGIDDQRHDGVIPKLPEDEFPE